MTDKKGDRSVSGSEVVLTVMRDWTNNNGCKFLRAQTVFVLFTNVSGVWLTVDTQCISIE